METQKQWDVFISHASEDKDSFVRPLADALRNLGLTLWYDEFSLHVGDSLSRSIDRGLADSRFGIVVITPNFIRKSWPEYELRGLVSREVGEGRVILPIWHGVTRGAVVDFSPPLADKVAVVTSGKSARDVAIQILQEVRPDLYAQHTRVELERLAKADDLDGEISRASRLMGHMPWPVTVVRIDEVQGTVETIALNDEARELYCMRSASDIRTVDLMRRLGEVIRPGDWLDLVIDQRRALDDALRGRVPKARVPLRLSKEHPVPKYRGKSLIPLVAASERSPRGAVLLCIIYLDDSLANSLSEVDW